MTAVLVFLIVFAVSVKTFSYGIWEAKRENAPGGIFVIMLACFNVFMAATYLVKYWT